MEQETHLTLVCAKFSRASSSNGALWKAVRLIVSVAMFQELENLRDC
jgi:hypothetical protein